MAINVQGSADYQAVLRKINLWYGEDAQTIINIANEYELTPQQLVSDYLTGSGFEPWYSTSGALGGYNSVGTASINPSTAFAEAANSNTGATTITALKTPIETTVNQSGKVVSSSGLTSVATGAKSALTFITKDVLPAVSAAGLGITLGKTISKAAYDAGFNWLSWAGVDMESLNPETWNNITKDYPDGTLKKAFNTVFGLNPNTGETQLYLDEDSAVYLAQYLNEIGMFSTGSEAGQAAPDQSQKSQLNYPNAWYANGIYYATMSTFQVKAYVSYTFTENIEFSTPVAVALFVSSGTTTAYFFSTTPFTATWKYINDADGRILNQGSYTGASGTDCAQNTYYVLSHQYATGNGPTPNQNPIYDIRDVAFIILHGNIQIQPPPAIDGITNQDNATTPNFAGCETPQDYLQALQNQYPDLFNNAVTQSVVNPDGTTSTKKYLPIGTTSKNNNGNKEQPITNTTNSGNTQQDTTANPATIDLSGLEELIRTLTETISQTGTPTDITNPDPTGTGNTPPVVTPTGNASALWSVYNPSQAQLNSFGAWLWSSNFIDQVLKLFNNPMQSIIGVHKIFATPATTGTGNITVGYLSSGVSANLVSNQYTDINCGTVKVSEQFGNVFDYTDTQIRLYLPFIGIVDLDVSDVMRGSVSVVYHVDVITGACLAEVKVSRDGAGGTLYQYAGDAAVRYPISSGSYMGVVAGIASAVGGVASAVMTGGATLPMAAGAIAGGISGAHTQVQHSGNFSGNAGAMGGKKPYLIIERPQTMIADGFASYQGKGANVRRTVGQMSGYFKFSDVHTDSINGAAESEIEAIRAALESGVIA